MRLPVFSWLFLMVIYSLFLSICVRVSAGQCFGNQQSLLLQLKNNLTFYPAMSTKLARWNQSTNCCSWEGVTCYKGLVIGLDLTNESISGVLDDSSSLFGLQHLQSLSLAYNDINDSHIPSKFDKLANLRYLNLSNAGFAGQIPIAISRLTRLVTLDLSCKIQVEYLELENPNLNMLVHNLSGLVELHLDGVSISAQGNEWYRTLSSSLPNLRVLSLSSCYLSGPIDSSLRNLQFLSIIRLNDNNFSAPIPDFFVDFKNLTSLEISNSWIDGKFPKKIFQIPTLRTLDLSNNFLLEGYLPEFPPNGSLQTMMLQNTKFSKTLPPSIGNLKQLVHLDMSFNSFSGSIPNSMARLTRLVYLDMSFNNFSGSIPNSMARLTRLVYLDMSFNNFSGSIPNSMARLTQLIHLYMSVNNFSGSIPNSMARLTRLVYLDMSVNNFNGSIPNSMGRLTKLVYLNMSINNFNGSISNPIGRLTRLVYLDMSVNNFSGSIPIFSITKNLEILDLSENSLNGKIPISLFCLPSLRSVKLFKNQFSGFNNQFSGQMKEFSNISSQGLNSSLQLSVIQQLKNLVCLDLSHNKLKTFPDFLRNQSSLEYLDLSDNQIYGEIPNWVWKLPKLSSVDLSYNFLVTLEVPILNLSLHSLNLHSNHLQGQLPIIPSVQYLDFSSNHFHSSIPRSICNIANLEVLDLSNNSFSGTIPECLISMSETLTVLDLRTNNLNGTIPNAFTNYCGLQFLALNGNQLGGELPKNLASCTMLKVLDVGNNLIKGTFPFYLKNASLLKVLILRNNKFYGSIAHLNPGATWQWLQILDIALNNFTSRLPIIPQFDWMAMMDRCAAQCSKKALYQNYGTLDASIIGYQFTVTTTIKGKQLKLVRIQNIVTILDFSCNNFDGPIPEEIGQLTLLYTLNLSHNALTGQIPQSLGKLSNLESLDLSSNQLSGKIPVQLADGLIFLSVLNLSFNQLVGQIPFIKQFGTFLENSYKENKGLCGLPLKSKCTYEEPPLSPPTYEESHLKSRIVIEWNYISVELGFVFGFGVVIGPLMFWKRWRIWYSKHVDDIFFKIYPQLYFRNERHRR
jgi:Leucine-rich repeat (LRR) protein